MNNTFRTHENGNVLFLILIAVALFAALGYTVSGMLRSGNPTTIAGEQAKIYAGEILDYARNVRQAVQTMRISNGCRDTEISFEGGGGGVNYTHTPAASVECTVFSPSGGGLSYLKPNTDALATSIPAAGFMHGDFHFIDQFMAGVGTAGSSELMMRLKYLSKSVCLAINDRLGITNPSGDAPIDTNFSSTNVFNGDYFASPNGATTIDTPQTQGAMAACFYTSYSGAEGYYFYQVLIAR